MSLLRHNPKVNQGASVCQLVLLLNLKRKRKKWFLVVVFSCLALAAHWRVTLYTKIFKEMAWKGQIGLDLVKFKLLVRH